MVYGIGIRHVVSNLNPFVFCLTLPKYILHFVGVEFLLFYYRMDIRSHSSTQDYLLENFTFGHGIIFIGRYGGWAELHSSIYRPGKIVDKN
jgi:hypothetical protein